MRCRTYIPGRNASSYELKTIHDVAQFMVGRFGHCWNAKNSGNLKTDGAKKKKEKEKGRHIHIRAIQRRSISDASESRLCDEVVMFLRAVLQAISNAPNVLACAFHGVAAGGHERHCQHRRNGFRYMTTSV